MESKKIYLIRHGQTDYNLQGIVQGSGVDTDLNDTGREQARLFFEKYKNIPFSKIYTSKLKRTIQSVQPYIDMGIPYESYSGLNEISWGNKDGKLTSFDKHNPYWEMVKEWREGHLDYKVEGGESPNEVWQRQKVVIDLITSKTEENPILICMHGRAMRILLASLTNKDLSLMDTFLHDNLCLYVINYDKQGFSIEIANNKDHLLPLNS